MIQHQKNSIALVPSWVQTDTDLHIGTYLCTIQNDTYSSWYRHYLCLFISVRVLFLMNCLQFNLNRKAASFPFHTMQFTQLTPRSQFLAPTYFYKISPSRMSVMRWRWLSLSPYSVHCIELKALYLQCSHEHQHQVTPSNEGIKKLIIIRMQGFVRMELGALKLYVFNYSPPDGLLIFLYTQLYSHPEGYSDYNK